MRKNSQKGISNKAHRSSIFSVRELATSTILGTLSIFLVLAPDVRLPWGMAALDFIAVPWIVAFLLFGFKSGLLASIIGSLGILFFSEESVPFVGATMKFSATIPMIAIPMVILNFPRFRKSTESLVTRKLYVFSMAIAILVRCFITMLLNYYWAIPVMFGLSPNEVPGNFNWFFWGNPMSSNPLIYYILGVSIWNTWQGAVDAIVSWFVVYPTKLYKQYKWR